MWSRSGRLVKIKHTSPFQIHPNVPLAKRKQILLLANSGNSNFPVYKTDDVYYKPYQMILKQRQALALAAQNQILFSPRFTPGRFKTISLFGFFCIAFLFYHAYIHMPQHMMRVKKEKNRRFKQLEGKGWLEGWEEEEDRVLKLEAESLEDLDRLEGAGVLPGYKQERKVPKKEKFVGGARNFELGEFKKA